MKSKSINGFINKIFACSTFFAVLFIHAQTTYASSWPRLDTAQNNKRLFHGTGDKLQR